MLHIVLFEDNPASADEIRRRHMPEHLKFLEGNGDRIKAAGPLRDTAGGSPAGGLWLVEAEGSEAVTRLVEADPFWPTGLRRSVRILEWKQVFADGVRRI